MNANRQRFFHNRATARTQLTRLLGVNLDHRAPSVFCFGAQYVQELSPASVRNAFGQVSVANHVLGFEFFNGDQVMLSHKVKCQFMLKIQSLIANLLMHVGQFPHRLASAIAAFSAAGHRTLGGLQSALRHTIPARIVHRGSVAIGEKRFQAHVNTNAVACRWHWIRLGHLATETGIPFTVVALDGDGLDPALNGAMQDDVEHTDVGQPESVAFQLPARRLRVAKTIKTMLALKAWMAWILALLAAFEKRLVCLIQPAKCVLQHLTVNKRKLRAVFFDLAQLVGLGIVVDVAHTIVVVGGLAFLKCTVIQPETKIKRVLESFLNDLRFRGDAILERASDGGRIACSHISTSVAAVVRSHRQAQTAGGFAFSSIHHCTSDTSPESGLRSCYIPISEERGFA